MIKLQLEKGYTYEVEMTLKNSIGNLTQIFEISKLDYQSDNNLFLCVWYFSHYDLLFFLLLYGYILYISQSVRSNNPM